MDYSLKDTNEFLNLLRKKNIHLRLQNNNVRIEAAKSAITPALVKEIKKRKSEIIDFFRELRLKNKEKEAIPAAEAAESYPLSSNQMGLWLSSQLHQSSTAFNMHGNLKLNRMFRPDCLQEAIARTVARHEILRTVFRKDDAGKVQQWIQEPENMTPELVVMDLETEPEADEKVARYIEKDTRELFDLESGPLFRVVLFKLAEDRCVLYYNMHHIISDAWSMNVLVKEVLAFYEHLDQGRTLDLPPLPIQYKDYAVWQQQQLESGEMEPHRIFWKKQFDGTIPVLDLFPDTKRPAVKTTTGRVLSAFIPESTAGPFEQLCKSRGGSLYMGLITAVRMLLYRYTGQQDVILGTPVSGRKHADLNNQIGFYINTLALRTPMESDESFETLFDKVSRQTIEAYRHDRYPFNDVLESLQLERDQSRSPLFDVFINLQNVEEAATSQFEDMEELFSRSRSEEIFDMGASKCKFDLVFNFQEFNGAIYLALEYNTDIYEQTRIRTFIGHLRSLLRAICEKPSVAVGKLDFLSEEARRQVVEVFSGTDLEFNRKFEIIRQLEHWADKQGDEIALRFNDQLISYRELNERANQLAHWLIAQKVNRDDLVPILMDRSPGFMVSILAVLKAGAAFVPLDKSYPAERLRYILGDMKADLALADEQVPAMNAVTEVLLMPSWADLPTVVMEQSKKNPGISCEPDQLAYVIYTSGSTGRAKGVAIERQQLDNYLNWVADEYLPEENTGRIGWFTSPSFDLSITSMFSSLLKGKTLTIYPQDMEEVELLTAYLDVNSGHDLIKLTPAHIDLIKAAGIERTEVSRAIVGGDVLLPRQVAALRALNPKIRIYNEYGPTETTVGCCVAEISSDIPEQITIGKPVKGTYIYILNDELEPLPVGLNGELYISGKQVGRGYLNNPALTQERFIDDPFRPGHRMYKSGDRGRWLPDGKIEFAGRMDDQIKLRGYRIELKEIEKVVSQFSPISEACVLSRPNEQDEQELVLFYSADQPVRAAEISEHLAARLPAYMIPSHFQQLEALPLTPNGKLDRKRLMRQKLARAKQEYIAPRNEVEQKLAAIWEEILDLERVGIRDNFFELGGHSIKAIKILSMVHKQFDVTLGIQKMFENPTPEYLAELIADAQWIAGQATVSEDETEIEKVKI